MSQLALTSAYENQLDIFQLIGVIIIQNIINLPINYLLPYIFNKVNELKQKQGKRLKKSKEALEYVDKTKYQIITHSKNKNNEQFKTRNLIAHYNLLSKYKRLSLFSAISFLCIMFLCILYGFVTMLIGINMFIIETFSPVSITVFIISLFFGIISSLCSYFCISDNKVL